MANDSDVARVFVALRTPAIRYFSFGNAPVRPVAPPAEEAAEALLSQAVPEPPQPVLASLAPIPAAPALDPAPYSLLRIVEDEYVPPALAIPAPVRAPSSPAMAPVSQAAEQEWALLGALSGEAAPPPAPIRLHPATAAVPGPEQAAPRLLSVLLPGADSGAPVPAP